MEIKINLNINDRIVNFVKKMFSGKMLIVSLTVLTLTTGILLYAAPVTLNIFNSGDVISAAAVNENFAKLKAQIDAVEANSQGAPVGTIMAFAGTSTKVPPGWLICDGQSYNKDTYATLYDKIQNNWGGDGASTFKVPDLRGVSLRGSNKIGATNRTDAYADPDFANRYFVNAPIQELNNSELIGSFQMDAFQGHWHNSSYVMGLGSGSGVGLPSGPSGITLVAVYSPSSDGTNGTPRTSSESRGKNAAVHYIIKY